MTGRELIGRGLVRAMRPRRAQGFPWSAPTWPETLERPAPERGLGVDYPTDWARRYPARLLRALVLDNVTRPLTHVVTAPEVRGIEVLDLLRPPVIFASNHASHVDTPLLLSVLPPHVRHRTVVAAAADHFFDRRWKAHLWALLLALVPIERHRVDRQSVNLATGLLAEGWNLIIYPEGGRSPDGWLRPFQAGAAYLAARSGRPLVPVHLEGTHRILPRDGKRVHRGKTTVTFGTPIVPSPADDARRLATRLEGALGILAEERASDFWRARRLGATSDISRARGPEASPWRRAWALDHARPEDTEDERRWAVTGPGARKRRTSHARSG